MLHVTLDGEITELIAFGNVVPTGIDTRGSSIYVSQTGPVPHLPEDGKVVLFALKSTIAKEVAAGVRMPIDVELGPGNTLYALSQGVWDGPFE